MNQSEFREAIARRLIQMIMKHGFIDDDWSVPEDTVEVVITVRGVDKALRKTFNLPDAIAPKEGNAVIALRTLVDGRDDNERIGQPKAEPPVYPFVEECTADV